MCPTVVLRYFWIFQIIYTVSLIGMHCSYGTGPLVAVIIEHASFQVVTAHRHDHDLLCCASGPLVTVRDSIEHNYIMTFLEENISSKFVV
jgi:hypothetical protein